MSGKGTLKSPSQAGWYISVILALGRWKQEIQHSKLIPCCTMSLKPTWDPTLITIANQMSTNPSDHNSLWSTVRSETDGMWGFWDLVWAPVNRPQLLNSVGYRKRRGREPPLHRAYTPLWPLLPQNIGGCLKCRPLPTPQEGGSVSTGGEIHADKNVVCNLFLTLEQASQNNDFCVYVPVIIWNAPIQWPHCSKPISLPPVLATTSYFRTIFVSDLLN